MTHRRPRARAVLQVLCAGAAWLAPAVSQAFDFEGDKALIAVTRDQVRTRIGTVSFTPQPGSSVARFGVRIDPQVMRDHFLSMREFKCLPAAQEITCFVPYPYRQPATVSAPQLAWLEHSLLFFYKQPADFGAKLVVYDWVQAANMLEGAATVINTTSLGMAGKPEFRVPLDALEPGAVVNDLVYNPLKTAFLAEAEERGATIVDGLGMLLHQAAPGFERWFGPTPAVDEATRQAVLSA